LKKSANDLVEYVIEHLWDSGEWELSLEGIALSDAVYAEALRCKEEVVWALLEMRKIKSQLEGNASNGLRCSALVAQGLSPEEISAAVWEATKTIYNLFNLSKAQYRILQAIRDRAEKVLGVPLKTLGKEGIRAAVAGLSE
jgi:hypothetical protein